MIDSIETAALSAAVQKFREYIPQCYGANFQKAKDYFRTASKFEAYAADSRQPYQNTLEEFYLITTGTPAFQWPIRGASRCCARALLVINDFYHGRNPQKRYCRNTVKCPLPYCNLIEEYRKLLYADMKSEGTIRTRVGRMKVFFIFLADNEVDSLESVSQELFTEFIADLSNRYSSQGKVSILYTLRNFFSYRAFAKRLTFNHGPFLTGLHSRKHERLVSFYTAEEVRRVMEAVDRSTPWGKCIYAMMLLACVYGIRSSDIKTLKLYDIDWMNSRITLTQFKTKQEISLPLIEAVKLALLDYIKNARPVSAYPNIFIRLRCPYIPYSMNDHFANKVAVYFDKGGVVTDGKHHGLHSLRHSLATVLLTDDVPVNEIAVILGHSSVTSTRAYIWSDIDHLRSAALEVPSYGK